MQEYQFLFFPKCQYQPPIQWVLWFFPGVKQPGHEVDRSPASGAKVENVWCYASSPSVCLHGMAGTTLSPPPFLTLLCCVLQLLLKYIIPG